MLNSLPKGKKIMFFAAIAIVSFLACFAIGFYFIGKPMYRQLINVKGIAFSDNFAVNECASVTGDTELSKCIFAAAIEENNIQYCTAIKGNSTLRRTCSAMFLGSGEPCYSLDGFEPLCQLDAELAKQACGGGAVQ